MLKRFENIAPHPALSGLVDKIWILETTGRVCHVVSKLIIPNGNFKIILPFRNSIITSVNSQPYVSDENALSFTGMANVPFHVDAKDDAPSGTIGFELTPIGMHRLFRVNQNELQNRITPLADIVEDQLRHLEERLANLYSAEAKIDFFQRYLLQKLVASESDPVFEYCIRQIDKSHGSTTVQQLQQQTGFSSRWLLMKFQDHLGLSVKSYCNLVRFNFVYRSLFTAKQSSKPSFSVYDHYYDQSHVIKDFQRFTGTVPSAFNDSASDFGKIFFEK
jgi:AraC-like DNA-binding protein